MENLTLDDIKVAEARIRPFMAPSAVKESLYLKSIYGRSIFLKLENLNISGSFKIRGALSALTRLNKDELGRGVVAASAGNHAQGVAYAARLMGTKATIFMPKRAPLVKVQATKGLGAEVILTGNSYDEAFETAIEWQKTNKSTMIHGFADQDVIAGQGTLGLELISQIDDLGLIIVSIGGGGLAAGILTAVKSVKPDIMVVGVQSKSYPAMGESFKNQKLQETAFGHTIADGIAVKKPSLTTFEIIKKNIDDIILVEETDLALAILSLMERDHLLAEGAGAASVAGLKYIDDSFFKRLGKRSIACVVSGGNIDVNLLRKIIPFSLRSIGRLMRISVYIQDLPGRLADLLNIVSKTGANLQDVHHNRVFGLDGFENVEVKLDLEILDNEHKEAIIQALKDKGLLVRSVDN
jgi:threonine dehydratase